MTAFVSPWQGCFIFSTLWYTLKFLFRMNTKYSVSFNKPGLFSNKMRGHVQYGYPNYIWGKIYSCFSFVTCYHLINCEVFSRQASTQITFKLQCYLVFLMYSFSKINLFRISYEMSDIIL